MGIYNIILINKNCPKCNNKNLEWQTKDLIIDNIYPVANVISRYKINKRMTATVYTNCNECETAVEIYIKDGKIINENSSPLHHTT